MRRVAGGVRGFGLQDQVLAADDAVLMVTEQRLNRLGLLGHPGRAGGGGGVAKALGALADSMDRLVALVLVVRVFAVDLGGGLLGFPDLLVRGVDGHRRLFLDRSGAGGLGRYQVEGIQQAEVSLRPHGDQ